ncbi:hypothetical protein Tco_1394846 [Tanacetum coccineum]
MLLQVNAEFLRSSLICQEISGRAVDLEEIQEEDTPPSEITSNIPQEVKGFEPPQEEVIPIRSRFPINGYLDEDIYMVQPEGFVDPNHPEKVHQYAGLVLYQTINEPVEYVLRPIQQSSHYAKEPGSAKAPDTIKERYHMFRQCVELGYTKILKVHTDNNIA